MQSAPLKGAQEQPSVPDENKPRLSKELVEDGKLTIEADNSDLAEILRSVSAISGMEVRGTVNGTHIFGVYGPGNPQDVLRRLLDNAGYDFVMAGVAREGIPRELMLKPRKQLEMTGPQSPGSPGESHTGAAETAAATDAEAGAAAYGAPAEMSDAEPLGPGAIAHVPPNEMPEATSDANAGTRRQQNLERLQKMQDGSASRPQ